MRASSGGCYKIGLSKEQAERSKKHLAEVILGETHTEKHQCPQIHSTKTHRTRNGTRGPGGGRANCKSKHFKANQSKSENHDWHGKHSITVMVLYKVLYVQEMPHKRTRRCVPGVQAQRHAEGRQPETSAERQKYPSSATGRLWEDRLQHRHGC